ncbi:MAG: hypothetical protein A3F72_13010 [Bacteroidetes bacterium RIFCSPLOWO2_12_FULL_35_15]|nr:MAG: hypothetical protein A3F72_13010 [Bacteroidetes bacterium RIFCSPLOWO2_12_FULL_35_15]
MLADKIDRPLAGQFSEIHFGIVTPDNLWVKFLDSQYQEWVGSFANGWNKKATYIFNFHKSEKAIVVAGGIGYFVDISTRQLLNEDNLIDISFAIEDTERNRIIFSNGLDLRTFNLNNQETILFDEYYFDDIEKLEIKEDKLFVEYHNYQSKTNPFIFEMNLVTNEKHDTFFGENKSKNIK